MSQFDIEKMDPETFRQRANCCGLKVREVDLAQMVSRELISPWESSGGESSYTPLHLYVVARYRRKATAVRHPWADVSGEAEFAEITELAKTTNRLLDVLNDEGPARIEEWMARYAVEVERFLAEIDPFGPMTEFFDLLKPDVVSEMQNSGRLYLELKRTHEAVATRLREGRRAAESGKGDTQTMLMHDNEAMPDDEEDLRATQIIGDDDDEPQQPSTRDAIDRVVLAAKQSSVVEEEDSGGGEEDDGDDEDLAEDSQDVQVVELDVEPEDEESTESSGDGKRTVEQRVEALSQRPDDEGGPVPPPTPDERIAELNEKRRKFLDQKAWGDLVELYEEGIDLFSDPGQRQEIFLVLASIYEVKLRQKEDAFKAFAKAWDEGRDSTGAQKALEGIQRLGKSSGLHDRYLQWLEDQLDDDVGYRVRVRLQKELARGLFADQRLEDAFESYASFLMEKPNEYITAETLEQLERFGRSVDPAHLASFFDRLSDSRLDEATRQLVDDAAADAGAEPV